MNTNSDIDRILAGLQEHGFAAGDIVRLFGNKEDKEKALIIAGNANMKAHFIERDDLKQGQVVIIKGEDPIGKIDTNLLEKELRDNAVVSLKQIESKAMYADCLSGQERRRRRRELERKTRKK